MNVRWLLRATMWVRKPPSEKRVIFFVSIIAICLVIGFIEHYVGWPDWATSERVPRVSR